jgi:hypothetical protein
VTSVVVGGALASKAGSGGEAWVRLSYALGFRRLGCDVHLVEEAPGAAPEALAYAHAVADRFGLDYRPADEAEGGDLLVNVSGNVRSAEVRRRFRRSAFIDIDPGFTQFWHAQGLPGARVEGHDLHFTIGERIGCPDCPIPTSGVDWRPVRQPVVLDDWPVVEPGDADRFTTVGSWRPPFGPIEHDGRRYGLKHHEFRRFIELPARSPHEFEVALDIHPADDADRRALEQHGWHLVDPRRVAGDMDAFRAYVQGSTAEFSVAQGVYVETACGWFSDRSVRYLASGRPVLVQDSGFARILPAGLGLVAFRTLEEAVAGADDIVARYAEHAGAARLIAEHCFAAERVLARFCEEAGIG